MSTTQSSKQTKPADGIVGQPIARVDGRLKVTGGARFAVEWPIDRTAHAVLVGSTIANGTIKSIDTSSAEHAPGVLAVLTYKNAPRMKPVATNPAEGDAAGRRVPLQTPNVYYSNQYIAVVVADTFEQANAAAHLLKFGYDEKSPAADMNAERARAYQPRNVYEKAADTERGKTDEGLAAAEVKVDAIYRTPYENHNPMEPHGTTAVWEGNKLTVYDATQYTYGVRHALATSFGIPEENVRCVCKFTGGAFGCKGT